MQMDKDDKDQNTKLVNVNPLDTVKKPVSIEAVLVHSLHGKDTLSTSRKPEHDASDKKASETNEK